MVRFKNRYVLLEIVPDKGDQLQLKVSTLKDTIHQKVQEMYGDFGMAAIRAGFSGKYCNIHTKIALVRARHGPHKFVLNAIPLVKTMGKQHVKMNILYVGATIKQCFLYLRKYQETKLEQIWAVSRTDKERREMEEALMTLTPAMKDFI